MFPCPKLSGVAVGIWVDAEIVCNTPSMIPYIRMVYENGVKELSCRVIYCMAVCIFSCFMIYPFLFYTLCQKEFI